MKDSAVRFGLIGFGAWGKFHAGAIAKTTGAELVAISAPSDASRAAARDEYPNAAVYADYRELVARDDLDVVDVVVPSHLHHEIASAVLASGKHLLLEKPMALSLEQCDELIALAKKHDRLLAIGHELRFSSLWGKVKQLVDEGFIGEPKYALIELSRRPYRLGAEGWRYDIGRVGNWILEEPIHFFDLARWYFSSLGDPATVFATANSRQPDHPELQDNFSAIVQWPACNPPASLSQQLPLPPGEGRGEGELSKGNRPSHRPLPKGEGIDAASSSARGPYAVISQTLAAFEHHQTVKLTGTKGALWASWSGAMDRTLHPTFSLRTFDGENVETVPIDKVTGEVFELEDQMAMLVGAIRNGRPLSCTAEDGRWSVAMCLAASRSVETGKPEKIN